ncbi:MAG: hypothetical protein HPKKFMNG_02117 [Planctomycetes bacterium]|nr:hypothetical protein [Planctomycetota bacterium]MCQ3949617.1 hypothetical protein [Planctomycetota bacterium]GIK53124.1 MAG: hypothetical protein BroJett014_20970 [Planctomycetota bacterium]HRJ79181.1 hypothetical protein [Planctomycetota bacterium]
MAGELDTRFLDERPEERLEEAMLHERLATQIRAYGREIALACVTLCLLGMLAVLVAYLGRFNMGLSTPGSATLVSGQGTTVATQNRVDFTSLIVGFATTCFAANIVVFGGAVFQLRRLVPASAWTISLTACASAAALLMLTFGS